MLKSAKISRKHLLTRRRYETVKYHKRAIAILTDRSFNEIEARDLLSRIAQDNPSALVHAYDAINPTPIAKTDKDIALECWNRWKNSTSIIPKMEAIKELRIKLNIGLKEAKDLVESVGGYSIHR